MNIIKQSWLVTVMLLIACAVISCGNEQTFNENLIDPLMRTGSVGNAAEPSADACPDIDNKLVKGEGTGGGIGEYSLANIKRRAKEEAEDEAHEDVKTQVEESGDEWCQEAADEQNGEDSVQCYAKDATYEEPTYDEDGDGTYGEDEAGNDDGNGEGAEDGAGEENSGELNDGNNDGPTEESNWDTACARSGYSDCEETKQSGRGDKFANYRARSQQGVNITCKEVKSDPPFEQ